MSISVWATAPAGALIASALGLAGAQGDSHIQLGGIASAPSPLCSRKAALPSSATLSVLQTGGPRATGYPLASHLSRTVCSPASVNAPNSLSRAIPPSG